MNNIEAQEIAPDIEKVNPELAFKLVKEVFAKNIQESTLLEIEKIIPRKKNCCMSKRYTCKGCDNEFISNK